MNDSYLVGDTTHPLPAAVSDVSMMQACALISSDALIQAMASYSKGLGSQEVR